MDASDGDLNTLAGWRTYFAHPDAFIAGVDRDISAADLPIVAGAHTFRFLGAIQAALMSFGRDLRSLLISSLMAESGIRQTRPFCLQ